MLSAIARVASHHLTGVPATRKRLHPSLFLLMRRFSVATALLFGSIACADRSGGAGRQRLYLGRVRFEPPNEARPLPLNPGAAIDSVKAQQVAASLARQLVDEGYLDAKVQADLVPAGPAKWIYCCG
jgi:hypothetical protein